VRAALKQQGRMGASLLRAIAIPATDLSMYKENPYVFLKGILERNQMGDHQCKGLWAMDYKDFHAPNGVKSEFEYKKAAKEDWETDVSPLPHLACRDDLPLQLTSKSVSPLPHFA
jgi:hypothetical protein